MILNSERREQRYLALQVNLGLKATALLDDQNNAVLRHLDDRVLIGTSNQKHKPSTGTPKIAPDMPACNRLAKERKP